MKRIKTKRVQRLIADCDYWLASDETELFQESLAKLIEAADQDHPRVVQYLKTLHNKI